MLQSSKLSRPAGAASVMAAAPNAKAAFPDELRARLGIEGTDHWEVLQQQAHELRQMRERAALHIRLKELGILKLGHRCMMEAALRQQIPAPSKDPSTPSAQRATSVAESGRPLSPCRSPAPCVPASATPASSTINAHAALQETQEEVGARSTVADELMPRQVLSQENCPKTLQTYEVAHSPLVYVREQPDHTSKQLGYKWQGERVDVSGATGNWLKLAHEDGWMMRDGSSLGLGLLLRHVATGTAQNHLASDVGTGLLASPQQPSLSMQERLVRAIFEQRFPKHTPRADAMMSTDAEAQRRCVAKGMRKVEQGYNAARLPLRFRRWPQTGQPKRPPAEKCGGAVASVLVAETCAAHLTAEAFERDFVSTNTPLLIRNALRDWPPLRLWSNDYLRTRAGARRVPVRVKPQRGAHGVLFGDLQRMQAYETAEMRVDELLDALGDTPPRCYAARMELRAVLPELAMDTLSGPCAALTAAFGAARPCNPVCYIGAGGQATPAHFDPSENLLCVVRGSKRLKVFHPADTANLYPAGERNSAAVYSLVNFCEPLDERRFPDLKQAHAYEAAVEAGDVLYLPCGWWHAVQGSEDINISVNYWFELHDSKAGVDGLLHSLYQSEMEDRAAAGTAGSL